MSEEDMADYISELEQAYGALERKIQKQRERIWWLEDHRMQTQNEMQQEHEEKMIYWAAV